MLIDSCLMPLDVGMWTSSNLMSLDVEIRISSHLIPIGLSFMNLSCVQLNMGTSA